MKKIKILSLLFAAVLLLAACKPENSDPTGGESGGGNGGGGNGGTETVVDLGKVTDVAFTITNIPARTDRVSVQRKALSETDYVDYCNIDNITTLDGTLASLDFKDKFVEANKTYNYKIVFRTYTSVKTTEREVKNGKTNNFTPSNGTGELKYIDFPAVTYDKTNEYFVLSEVLKETPEVEYGDETKTYKGIAAYGLDCYSNGKGSVCYAWNCSDLEGKTISKNLFTGFQGETKITGFAPIVAEYNQDWSLCYVYFGNFSDVSSKNLNVTYPSYISAVEQGGMIYVNVRKTYEYAVAWANGCVTIYEDGKKLPFQYLIGGGVSPVSIDTTGITFAFPFGKKGKTYDFVITPYNELKYSASVTATTDPVIQIDETKLDSYVTNLQSSYEEKDTTTKYSRIVKLASDPREIFTGDKSVLKYLDLNICVRGNYDETDYGWLTAVTDYDQVLGSGFDLMNTANYTEEIKWKYNYICQHGANMDKVWISPYLQFCCEDNADNGFYNIDCKSSQKYDWTPVFKGEVELVSFDVTDIPSNTNCVKFYRKASNEYEYTMIGRIDDYDWSTGSWQHSTITFEDYFVEPGKTYNYAYEFESYNPWNVSERYEVTNGNTKNFTPTDEETAYGEFGFKDLPAVSFDAYNRNLVFASNLDFTIEGLVDNHGEEPLGMIAYTDDNWTSITGMDYSNKAFSVDSLFYNDYRGMQHVVALAPAIERGDSDYLYYVYYGITSSVDLTIPFNDYITAYNSGDGSINVTLSKIKSTDENWSNDRVVTIYEDNSKLDYYYNVYNASYVVTENGFTFSFPFAVKGKTYTFEVTPYMDGVTYTVDVVAAKNGPVSINTEAYNNIIQNLDVTYTENDFAETQSRIVKINLDPRNIFSDSSVFGRLEAQLSVYGYNSDWYTNHWVSNIYINGDKNAEIFDSGIELLDINTYNNFYYYYNLVNTLNHYGNILFGFYTVFDVGDGTGGNYFIPWKTTEQFNWTTADVPEDPDDGE